jgi:hypothetical protein
MNRKERRAGARSRLKVIRGGGGGGTVVSLPVPTRQSANTPAGRLWLALDQFVRQYAVTQPDLDEQTVVGTLLAFTSNFAAHGAFKHGADESAAEEFGRAAEHVFRTELAALARSSGNDPTERPPA